MFIFACFELLCVTPV